MLIVLCGIPCSGKSTLALNIQQVHFQSLSFLGIFVPIPRCVHVEFDTFYHSNDVTHDFRGIQQQAHQKIKSELENKD